MNTQTIRHVTRARYVSAIVAVIVIISLIPIAVAQPVGPDATVVAVSDSDGSTSDIDKIVSDAEASGAEVVMVTPDDSEKTAGYGGGGQVSEGEGAPNTDAGLVERELDGDLIAQEAFEGVQLMEPKVEAALSEVDDSQDILVVASGNGAGAAGNVLEMIAFDEGPVEKERILGHILIGDPYRTGSASEQSAQRGDHTRLDFEDELTEEPPVGFVSATRGVDELPEPEEYSEAERLIDEQLAQSGDNDEDSGVDRIGERNVREDTSALDDIYSSEGSGQEYGRMGDRKIIPRWEGNYGDQPMNNPEQVTPEYPDPPAGSSSDDSDAGSDSDSSASAADGDSDTGSGAGAGKDDPDAEVEDNFVEDDFSAGNGSDGADVQAARPPNPEANRGEGAMGDGDIWATEMSDRSSSERGVTASETSDRVTTPGTGILGQRERGFGDLDDSTLSVCSTQDARCASNGLPTLMVQVLTGDMSRTPELAFSVLRGITALGRLMSNVDKTQIAQLAPESTKCGVSAGAASAAAGTGFAAVSTGALAPAAVPVMASAAVTAGGAAQSCGRSAELSLLMAADIYKQYKSDPDLIQATELISLIDPDSPNGQIIQSALPIEFQNTHIEELMRRISSVGYALSDMSTDVYLEQMADGAGEISDLNPMGLVNLLTVSLSLTDALVKALFDIDQTMFGTFAEGIGGLGSSSMANTMGAQIGQGLTQAGAAIDPNAMSPNARGGIGGGEGNDAPAGNGRGSGDRSADNQLAITSKYAERYDYNEMEVGDGLSAIDFASDFARQAISV